MDGAGLGLLTVDDGECAVRTKFARILASGTTKWSSPRCPQHARVPRELQHAPKAPYHAYLRARLTHIEVCKSDHEKQPSKGEKGFRSF